MINEDGIRDRLFKRRYYGYWKFARKVYIEQGKFFNLIFLFEGRKRPLKLRLTPNFKTAINSAQIIEYAKKRAPDMQIHHSAKDFLESASKYLQFKDEHDPEGKARASLAKAEILIKIYETKSARKEIKDLDGLGEDIETEARHLSLISYMNDQDTILVEAEYSELIDRFPNHWEARSAWVQWNLNQKNEGAEDLAKEEIANCPEPQARIDMQASLISFYARSERHRDATEIIDNIFANEGDLTEEVLLWLSDAREKIRNLESNRKNGKRKISWNSMRLKALSTLAIILIAAFVFYPSIKSSINIYSEIKNLQKLEEEGVLANGELFFSSYKDDGFGFVRVIYIYNANNENNRSHSMEQGSVIMRESAVIKLSPNTNSHPVKYLTESPSISTLHPITIENYYGIFFKHSTGFLLLVIFLISMSFIWLRDRYKKYKYRNHRRAI